MTGLLAVAALLAQLSWAATELGRHRPRSEERAKGTRRHWEPILQDSAKDPGHHRTRGQVFTIGCRAGWGCLGNSELPSLGVHKLALPQHSKWLMAWVISHPL